MGRRRTRTLSIHYGGTRALARSLGIPVQVILDVYEIEGGPHYRREKQKKRSGDYRTIHKPLPYLKTAQRVIHRKYLSMKPISSIAHGGVKKRNVITTAVKHWRSHSILAIDLSDAFGSISWTGAEFPYRFKREWKFQSYCKQKLHLPYKSVEILLNLLEVKEQGKRFLPQGSPASPRLFNVLCFKMHERLRRLAEARGGRVSIYVDNIFFSMPGPEIEQRIINAVYRIVEHSGFFINHAKSVYVRNGNRPGVPFRICGVNMMNGDTTLPPKVIDKLRAKLYFAGLDNDRKTRSDVWSFVKLVYGCWPPRLIREWRKGYARRQQRLSTPAQD